MTVIAIIAFVGAIIGIICVMLGVLVAMIKGIIRVYTENESPFWSEPLRLLLLGGAVLTLISFGTCLSLPMGHR